MDLEELNDQNRDASSVIRGFFFQILHTLIELLELKADETLAIEFGEDLAKINEEIIDFKQVKHTKNSISLSSKIIQEFLINSYKLWIKTNETSKHWLLTTSKIAIESDRTSPWLRTLEAPSIDPESFKYLKKKKPNLKNKALQDWNNLVAQGDENLHRFLRSIVINSEIKDYKNLLEDLNTKISKLYHALDATQLIDKLVFYLFAKSSEDGLKLLTTKDLDGIVNQVVDKQSTLFKLVENFHSIQTTLLQEMRSDIKQIGTTVNEVVAREEIKPLVEAMEQALKSDKPKTVINISETAVSKVDNANKEMKFRYYAALGRAYHSLADHINTAKNYRLASSFGSDEIDIKYFEGLWNLYKDTPDILKAKGLAEEIINKDLQEKKGHRLKLLCGVDDLDKYLLEIPDQLKEDVDICSLIGLNYNNKKDFDQAITWAAKSINTDNPKVEYKVAVAEYRLVKLLINVHIVHNPSPSIKIKEELLKFKNELDVLWGEIKDRETAPYRTSVLTWIADLKFLLNDPSYMDTLDRAIDLSNDKTNGLYIKSQFLIAKGDKEGGTEILNQIKTPVTELQQFELGLSQDKSYEDIVKETEVELENLNTKSKEFSELAVITLLRFTRNFYEDKLKETLNAFKKHLDEDYITFFEIILNNPPEERAPLLETLGENAKEKENKLLVDMIIYELRNIGNQSAALKLLEYLADPHFFTLIDSDIISLSKHTESQDKQYERLEQYLNQFGNIPQVLTEKLALDSEINDRDSQVEIIDQLLKNDPDNLYLLLTKAITLVEQGKPVNLDPIEKSYNINTDRIEYGINLAFLYAKLGKPEESLDLLYRIRRRHPLVRELNLSFFKVMNTYFRDNHPEWIGETVINDHYAVTIVDGENQREYILEGNLENSELLDNERNKTQEVYKKLINKSLGSEIEGLGKVTVLKHKYVALYQKLLLEPDEYFPEGSIKKFNVKLGEEMDLSEVLAQAEKIKRSQEDVINTYKSNNLLPLSSLAIRTGKKYYEVFEWAVTDSEIKLRCSEGTANERDQASSIATELSTDLTKDIVLDLSAILTLDWLGLLDKFKKLLPNILITPSIIDLLSEWIEEQENFGREETITLGVENGQARTYINSKEFNLKRLEKLSSLKEWLEGNTSQVPTKKILEMPADQRESFSNFIGDYSFESIYLAAEKAALLISDEHVLRAIAKNSHGVDGLWIQPLLQMMLSNNLITSDEYNQNINRLIMAGYQHLSINHENLITQVKLLSYYPDESFMSLIDILKLADPISASSVLANFLVSLYQEPIITERQDAITISILTRLKSRDNFRTFMINLIKIIRARLFLQPIALEEIETTIRTWLTTGSKTSPILL